MSIGASEVLELPERVANADRKRVFIDTRSPEAFAAGHVPNAVNMPELFGYVCDSSPAGLQDLKRVFTRLFAQAGVTGDDQVVVYEDGMDLGNGQSSRGYFLLKYLGHPQASVLHGGFRAWVAAGLPQSTEAPKPVAADLRLTSSEAWMATKADVLGELSSKRALLVDVRDESEWVGQTSTPTGNPPHLRRGRIPGAVWLPWRAMLFTDNGVAKFRPANEIRRVCAEAGIGETSEVIVYCFKGSRASSSLVALREAGIRNVKNYFSSWNEWGADPTLPVVAADN